MDKTTQLSHKNTDLSNAKASVVCASSRFDDRQFLSVAAAFGKLSIAVRDVSR